MGEDVSAVEDKGRLAHHALQIEEERRTLMSGRDLNRKGCFAGSLAAQCDVTRSISRSLDKTR